jgi:hypothetical protein
MTMNLDQFSDFIAAMTGQQNSNQQYDTYTQQIDIQEIDR